MNIVLKKAVHTSIKALHGIEALPEQLQFSCHGQKLIPLINESEKTVFLIVANDQTVGCFYIDHNLAN